MYQIQTILVYILLYFTMLHLSYKAIHKKKWNLMVFALLIYSIIFGLRYEVGMDYPIYLDSYNSIGRSNIYAENDFEPGFMFIIQTLNAFNAHFTIFFGIIAFIQIYFVFNTFKTNFKIYPYLVFTFMFGCLWLDFGNGLRQILSLCLFIYSISLLDKKYWLFSCTLCFLLAFSFHKSALFLIPLYFLLKIKDEWFSNLKIQYILFIVAFIIGNIGYIQQILRDSDFILSYMGYNHYTERTDLEEMVEKEVKRGIGFYGILITDIILVSFSNKVKKSFSYNKYFIYIYNLYFVGIFIRYGFLSSMLIQRLNYYFYNFKFIVTAHTLMYSKKNNGLLYYSLIFLYLLYFVGILSSMETNTSLFKFFWQATIH